jgi:uncharacterized peroxidase-related enzyme
MDSIAVDGARLPMIDVGANVPDDTRAMFDKFITQRGRVPNLFRIAALRPPIAETLAAHLDAVMGPGEVSTQLKEMIACRVSQINHTPYCLASHSKLARKAGATDAQLTALSETDYSGFEPGWSAAFAYASEVAAPGGYVSDATFAALAEHWTAPQIVEITAVATAFSLFNRFADALNIPITT